MKHKGFTLIELIVVVGIIGILASLAVISLSRQQARSRDARRLGDMTNINTALQSYIAEKLDPPVSTAESSGWDMSSYPTNNPGATGFISGLTTNGYMTKVPVDPINNATANYWWESSLNGFTYGYYWQLPGSVYNGYYVYWLGSNLEVAGNPAIYTVDAGWKAKKLVFNIVPVRPAN